MHGKTRQAFTGEAICMQHCKHFLLLRNLPLAELEGLRVGHHLLLGLELLVNESHDHIHRMNCCH